MNDEVKIPETEQADAYQAEEYLNTWRKNLSKACQQNDLNFNKGLVRFGTVTFACSAVIAAVGAVVNIWIFISMTLSALGVLSNILSYMYCQRFYSKMLDVTAADAEDYYRFVDEQYQNAYIYSIRWNDVSASLLSLGVLIMILSILIR